MNGMKKRCDAGETNGNSVTMRRTSERNEDRLLRGHDEVRAGLWRTLHSMRNVESSGVLKLNE